MIRTINKADVICGLTIILFCSVGLYMSFSLTGRGKYFPIVSLLGMASLSLTLVVNGLKGQTYKTKTIDELERELKGFSEEVETSENGLCSMEPVVEPVADARTQRRKIVAALLVTILYIGLMPFLGFALSTVGYIFLMLFFLGMRRYLFMVIIAVLTDAVIFLTFRTIMYISIPEGLFDPTEYIYQYLGW